MKHILHMFLHPPRCAIVPNTQGGFAGPWRLSTENIQSCVACGRKSLNVSFTHLGEEKNFQMA